MATIKITYVGKMHIPMASNQGTRKERVLTVDFPNTDPTQVQTQVDAAKDWLISNPSFFQPTSWADDTTDDAGENFEVYSFSETDDEKFYYEIVETTTTNFYVTP